MHALLIFLEEPIPGPSIPVLCTDGHPHESIRRYRAIISVLLQQLEGLRDTHVRIYHSPEDAGEAITFWLLPQLRGQVVKRDSDFLFTPEKNAPPISIDFKPLETSDSPSRHSLAIQNAFENGFKKVAIMDHTCLECGSRWIHTAMLQLKSSTCIIGPNQDGSCYFLAASYDGANWLKNTSQECHEYAKQNAQSHGLSPIHLPTLNTISSPKCWEIAIESPIGGKLTAALKREL